MSLLQNIRSCIFNGSPEFLYEVADGIEKLAQVEVINNNKSQSSLNVVVLNLFDRIYGEDSTGFVAENTWVEKHGNWIATSSGCVEGEKQWGHVNGCYISSRGARLLQLMSPTGKLFKSMLKMNWHFQMNVNLLSEKAQMKLGNSKEYLFIAAAHHLLYDNLLKMQPQRKSITTEIAGGHIRVDAFFYNLTCMLRYAVYHKDFATTFSTGPRQQHQRSVGSLSSPSSFMYANNGKPSSLSSFYEASVSNWKSGNVYLALVDVYFKHFSLVLSDCSHEDARLRARHLPYETELFIWLIVDQWVDIPLIINRGFDKISALYSGSRDSNYIHHHHSHPVSFAPKSCAEVVFLDSNSPLPTCAAMECTYLLIDHLQSSYLGGKEAPYLFVPLMVPVRGSSSIRSARAKGDGMVCRMYTLPRALEILQQPLFDMLRALFTKFDTISPSHQLMAMALWLRWSQPWRFYDSSSSIFGDTQPQYSSVWRPYIAANFHFYTSLFVILLRSSVYLNVLSSTDYRSRDGKVLSVVSHQHFNSSSGYVDREIQKLCIKLFDIIIDSYVPIKGSGNGCLYDDIGMLYSGVTASGGDSANVDVAVMGSIVGDLTGAKPSRKRETSTVKKTRSAPLHKSKQKSRSVSPTQNRFVSSDYSDDEEEPDKVKNCSRLLEPPSSFSQRQSPVSSLSGRPQQESSILGYETSVRNKVLNNTVDAIPLDTVPRRRLSTSYTPLDSSSPNGSATIGNSWSGVVLPRRRTSSIRMPMSDISSPPQLMRGKSSDPGSAAPQLMRGKSSDPGSTAEIMSIFHQHAVLYPDECIPTSWASGCSLKEASEAASKLEILLAQAENNRDISRYVRKVSESLRSIPGLIIFDSTPASNGPQSQVLSPPLLKSRPGDSLYASPERHVGTALHGQLTPKGREELLSGKKACNLRSIRHRGDIMLRPLCSNEFPALTRVAISLSIKLNTAYNLPKNDFTVQLSWTEVIGVSVSERTSSLLPFKLGLLLDKAYLSSLQLAGKNICHDILGTCRFNLRILGNFNFLGYLVGVYATMTVCRFLWGPIFLSIYISLAVVGYVIYFVL